MRNFNLGHIELFFLVIAVLFLLVTLLTQVDDALATKVVAFLLELLLKKLLNNIVLEQQFLVLFLVAALAFDNAYDLNSLSVPHEFHALDELVPVLDVLGLLQPQLISCELRHLAAHMVGGGGAGGGSGDRHLGRGGGVLVFHHGLKAFDDFVSLLKAKGRLLLESCFEEI